MRRTVTAIVIGLVSAAAGFTQSAEPPDPVDSRDTELSLLGRADGPLSLEQAVAYAQDAMAQRYRTERIG